ncbi:MAG: hypothetical protein HY505_03135 [Candidatus Yanofskybacteria bacterium]|nr:hypothetical protein [Candidatus Yanofskybacteria bacterium]
MFLFIPLILILASAGGIVFIVWRKLPRLEELAETESNSTVIGSINEAFWESGWRHIFYDLCPEIWNWVRSVKVKEYKEMWFVETEKLLRRLRLVSLKMDRFSDSLIKKIRKRTNSNNGNGSTFSVAEVNSEKQNAEAKPDEKIEFKKTEQRLIIEIAKNPKNAALYEELGDLYSEAGEHKDAKESYEAAIELNSNSEELKKKLSQALERLNPQN